MWRFVANNPEIHHYFDTSFASTSTWNCPSLITISRGGSLHVRLLQGSKMANISEAGVFVHMFRSISIPFVPVAAAAIPTTRWWRSWNCWQKRWVIWRKQLPEEKSVTVLTQLLRGEVSSRFAFLSSLRWHVCQPLFWKTIFMSYFLTFLSAQWCNDYDGRGQPILSWIVFKYAALH